jgi:hypothetical protein
MSIIPDAPFVHAPDLPHEVALPRLSIDVLGRRFENAFVAYRCAAADAAAEGWTAHAVHTPGAGTSYVFRFADAIASLRFAALAAAALEPRFPTELFGAMKGRSRRDWRLIG